MFYDDDPDPYDGDRHYQRRGDVYRRRSSPSLIDDDRLFRGARRAASQRTSQAQQYRGYDDSDDPRQARPNRINFDDDEDDDLWPPQAYGQQRTRIRHLTDPAPYRREPSWTSHRHRQQQAYYADDYSDDSRRWETAKSRQTQQHRRHEDDLEDPLSSKPRHTTQRHHSDIYGDVETSRNPHRGDRRATNYRQTSSSHRRNFDDDSEPSYNAPSRTSVRKPAPVRRPRQDEPAPQRTFERRSAPVQKQPSPVRHRYDDSGAASESDALSIFAHIRTDSDSGSSGNGDNFDDDQYDDVENAQPPSPVRRNPKPKKKPPPSKPKKTPKPQHQRQAPVPKDDESSFTMGSNEESIEIPAIPPPGPQVAASDATAVAAMLWMVDHLDRFSLGLTVVLSVIVVTALITAMVAHEPQLFVAVGVYAILWFLIHRESRALQDQVRTTHEHHAAMNAVELAEVDVISVARRTIQTTAMKLMRIEQVSAAGSAIFLILLAGLAIWAEAWAAFVLAIVVMIVSGAAAAMATVQYRTIINTTDGIMSEGMG